MSAGATRFYHLTRSAPERVIAQLCAKCREQGWRVLIRSGDSERLDRLDDALWQGPPESFLAHGRVGAPHEARQPILLSEGAHQAEAEALMAVHRAPVVPADAEGRERLFVLFEDDDPEAMEQARSLWREVRAAGLPAEYYSEADGRWTLKQRSPG